MIYSNLQEAKEACRKYAEAKNALAEEMGIFEECDDSCCEIYIQARYYIGASGLTRIYTLDQ